jgi:hypothetical protein
LYRLLLHCVPRSQENLATAEASAVEKPRPNGLTRRLKTSWIARRVYTQFVRVRQLGETR